MYARWKDVRRRPHRTFTVLMNGQLAEGADAGARLGPRGPVIIILLVAYLMIVIDSSIVITALPQIRKTFGMTESGLSWVQNAYLLAYGGFLLVGARAGDLLGRRRMFIVAVGMFTGASLAVGGAPSTPWLLAARAGQGLAAAILGPAALSLLQTNFRGDAERTRAVGYYSAAVGVGAMLGLVLGGIFTAWFSWRIGFLVNVPIGIALILATPRHLLETPKHAGQLDLLGAVSSTLAMTALVFGLVRVASTGWRDSVTAGILIAGTAWLVFFVRIEARAKQPIMPLHLFANRERSGAYTARLLLTGAIVGFIFFMALYLQRVLGFSPFVTGLAFLPMMLANFCTALAFPKLARRMGHMRLLAAALLTTLIGMAWLSRVSLDASFLIGVEVPMILIGAGGGGSVAPLTALGLSGVRPADAGAASGVVNVAHQIGGSLGLGILLVVSAAARSPAGGSHLIDARGDLAERVGAALAGGAVMLGLALLVILVLIARTGSLAEGTNIRMPRDPERSK